MPGVDFAAVRRQVSLNQVLELLGFVAVRRRGNAVRGPCPVHRSRSGRSRSLAVDLAGGKYHCFRCGSGGNQLDLWAAAHGISLYQAAVELCEKVGVEVPWIRRW